MTRWLSALALLALTPIAWGHVALTFPPARKFDLDFLDSFRTKPPCGMPKGESEARTARCELGTRAHRSAGRRGRSQRRAGGMSVSVTGTVVQRLEWSVIRTPAAIGRVGGSPGMRCYCAGSMSSAGDRGLEAHSCTVDRPSA